jgi:putative SOS response-associated peptidase YedK
MCGRYSLKIDFETLARRFKAEPPTESYPGSYNISPTEVVPVILNTNPKQIELARWGIIPSWDKTGKQPIINARKDSLEKPTFRKSFRERRCLVLADSFYEWMKTDGQTAKRPFRFLLKSEEPFAFAGIWTKQEDGESDQPHYAIITTEANRIVGQVHDRMPAILKPEAERGWLDLDTSLDDALELLQPYPDHEMRAYEISTLINSLAHDALEILKPILAESVHEED